jgi:chemotaxis protein histidine kinase CheA
MSHSCGLGQSGKWRFRLDDIEEYRSEAIELLDQAEKSLLAVDGGEEFASHYNSIFRVFHNLKGSAAMLSLFEIERHVHQIETLFQKNKEARSIGREKINFFLAAVDATRSLLAGNPIQFSYEPEPSDALSPASAVAPSQQKSATLAGVSACVVADGSQMNFVEEVRAHGCNVVCVSKFEDALKGDFLAAVDLFVLVSGPIDEKVELAAERVKEKNLFLPRVLATKCADRGSVEAGQKAGFQMVLASDAHCSRTISMIAFAARIGRLWRTTNKAMTLLLYRHAEFDEFLASQEKPEVRETLNAALTELLQALATTEFPIEAASLGCVALGKTKGRAA